MSGITEKRRTGKTVFSREALKVYKTGDASAHTWRFVPKVIALKSNFCKTKDLQIIHSH